MIFELTLERLRRNESRDNQRGVFSGKRSIKCKGCRQVEAWPVRATERHALKLPSSQVKSKDPIKSLPVKWLPSNKESLYHQLATRFLINMY